MMLKRTVVTQQNLGYYFPLFNLKGMRSSISPYFGGDLKLDHHHYFLEPTTEVDLYQNIMSRNVIVSVNDQLYFMNGQTAHQQSDELITEVGLLYQKVIRKSDQLTFEVTSFVALDDHVELHEIKLINPLNQPITIQVTTSIPIYARSADNLRDHRHVTSLLSRIQTTSHGVLNQPTLSFDERGHKTNHHIYSVQASSEQMSIQGFIPVLDDFVSGGSLHHPRGLHHLKQAGYKTQGYEAMGAIQFESIVLEPHQSVSLYVGLGIHEKRYDALKSLQLLNPQSFHQELKRVQAFFSDYVSGLSFNIVDSSTSKNLSWVVLQPMLRRYFGNSYLPHHDYGRGGKGWRDLWQDLLALIMMNDASVKELLYNNFLGVRIDGSNATIIGDRPGEFKADRNMITRVWSDHGAWPLLTAKMYIDETGDLDFLLKKQGYFQDQFTHYTKKTRPYTSNRVMTKDNQPYEGTILEHLLLQNLVGHHNIGDHGFVRLEDADWNDGLDMAHDKGETVAFTHMYANNLLELANMIDHLSVQDIHLFKQLEILLTEKPNLHDFFNAVTSFTGETITIDKIHLVKKLRHLAQMRIEHLRKHAFTHERFISYFNNDGINADHEKTMNLTGQAMALLSKTPTLDQAKTLSQSTRAMLFDPKRGGYALNTDYKQVLTNMGRAYGFAYGHKENGAVFSHMAMMYAYGLYQYNLIEEAREAWVTLIKRAMHPKSHLLVGIPEYFTDRGIGMYPYLTGSASWLLKLIRTEVFGIQMRYGKLFLEPKLTKHDFIRHQATVKTYLFGQLATITYHVKEEKEGPYQIEQILMNGKAIQQGITKIEGPIEVYLV